MKTYNAMLVPCLVLGTLSYGCQSSSEDEGNALGGSGGGGVVAGGGSGFSGGGTNPSGSGGKATGTKPTSATGGTRPSGTGTEGGAGGQSSPGTLVNPDGVPTGNPDGHCSIPTGGGLEDTSKPTTVVGTGTAASCTADAFVAAVAAGGIVTFDCGPEPVTITLTKTAKIVNNKGPKIVIDGGGKVTLSGGGKVQILYQNTCDPAQVHTTTNCNNQDHPQLTVQNLTFVHGNAKGLKYEGVALGGGAIYARGGRLKIVNSRFFNNVCDDTGPDVGGAAVRALSQYNGLPIYLVNSTFGGRSDLGNSCSNGGGISSIMASWTVVNSVFSHNSAVGWGENPPKTGTPGGGSGGAIYNDGLTMTLDLCGTAIENNSVKAQGSAIFFVSNDHSGNVVIKDSIIRANTGGTWYPVRPSISTHDDTPISVTNSTITQ